jgi:hypothetical protein
VTGQLQQLGGRLVAGTPKSDAGRRVIALDSTTISALREHRLRQQAERAAGVGWAGTGYVFTATVGKPVAPGRMTRLFARLVAGLRPAAGDPARAAARRRDPFRKARSCIGCNIP